MIKLLAGRKDTASLVIRLVKIGFFPQVPQIIGSGFTRKYIEGGINGEHDQVKLAAMNRLHCDGHRVAAEPDISRLPLADQLGSQFVMTAGPHGMLIALFAIATTHEDNIHIIGSQARQVILEGLAACFDAVVHRQVAREDYLIANSLKGIAKMISVIGIG